jgi:hypothetical protein
MAGAASYAVGEDVMYKGKRYTISEISSEPYSLRLLATNEPGPDFVWASADEVEPMLDDNEEYKSKI